MSPEERGGFASLIPWESLTGLRPRAWLAVGAGYSREDIKAWLLGRGLGFTADAVTNLEAICVRICAHEDQLLGADRVLGSSGRQEALRILISSSSLSKAYPMPELKRLRRQGNFYRRLDLAMQAGRMTFAHVEEGAVFSERLAVRGGVSPVREEIQQLSLAYEAWLQASGLMDPPMVIRQATEILRERGWPERLIRPERVVCLSVQQEESLERAFWEALGTHTRVERVGPSTPLAVAEREDLRAGEPPRPWRWDLWHTLDDAAECLAQEIDALPSGALEDTVVLIPDSSSARRSLRRALEARGIPLADPRDPTRLKWDEGLKWATIPLEVVARGFERRKALSFLRAHRMQMEFGAWATEIQARGVRQGLGAYAGGSLSQVHSFLRELQELFGGRKSLAELSEGHLKFLREAVGENVSRLWIVPFFENLWRDFVADSERVGLGDKKAPLLFWWERLQARLSESAAPVERAKPEGGVAVYRLHQAPRIGDRPMGRVFVLGLPANWLGGEGIGDYWFSERDRETLSSEFGVRSGLQIRAERLEALSTWLGGAEKVTILDAAYDPDGREREGTEAVFREVSARIFGRLGRGEGTDLLPEHATDCGAHPRWMRSYGSSRPLPPQIVKLPALPLQAGGAFPEITATAIDSYSRCGLQAMVYHRWRLKDTREADAELWPEARGNILHEAVKILVRSRDESGAFTISLKDALDEGWRVQRPKGLIKSLRTEAYAKAKMLQVLEAFVEKEKEYFTRAPSKTVSLDDQRFRLELDGVTLVGTPDRVDEHPNGELFIIDYKTSSALPNGTDMVDLGYRLQLPFYALAARRQLGKPVMGVQFVELNRKGGRGNGVFFKQHNGKEPGRPTQLRANSKSLLDRDPEATWSRLEETLGEHARAYVQGRFEARPKRREKECATCAVADVCGFRRLNEPLGEAGAE
jgi:RecB family exonuclease